MSKGELEVISLRVSEEEKERWEDYLEEDVESGNLSHLIRKSVHKEIRQAEEEEEEGSEVMKNRIGELYSNQTDMKDLIEDLESELGRLREEVSSKGNARLQKLVETNLPEAPETDEEGRLEGTYEDIGVTSWEIADEVDEDVEEVEKVLSLLERLGVADSMTDGEETLYRRA